MSNKVSVIAALLLALFLGAGCVQPAEEEVVIPLLVVASGQSEIHINGQGGTESFEVRSNSSWSMKSSLPSWLSVSPTSGGDGTATVTVRAEENPQPAAREATLEFSSPDLSRTIKVIQNAGEEKISINPTSAELPSEGGEIAVTVTTNSEFTVQTTADWIHEVSSQSSGQIRKLQVDANASDAARSSEVKFVTKNGKSQTLTVSQMYTTVLVLDKSELTYSSNSSGSNVKVTSNTRWSVKSDADWCTVSPASAQNNGTFQVTVSANTTTQDRKAVITVTTDDGKVTETVNVTQAAASFLSVSTKELKFSAEQSTSNINVTSNTCWSVKSNAEWCMVSISVGQNNDTIEVFVRDNSSVQDRNAIITITTEDGKVKETVSVTQAAASFLSVSTKELKFSSEQSTSNINVTSNRKWNVKSDADWCKISPASGQDDASIQVNVSGNTTTQARKAVITVTTEDGNVTETVNITQTASSFLSVSTKELKCPAEYTNLTFNVTSNTRWNVKSDADWCIALPSSGQNNASIEVFVRDNSAVQDRSAIITVTTEDGKLKETVKVTQAAASFLSVSTDNLKLPAVGASAKISVSSNTSWKVLSDISWCNVTPTTGTGDAYITVSASDNPNLYNRTDYMYIQTSDNVEACRINIEQEAAKPFAAVSKTSFSFPSSESTGVFTITSNTSWSISSDADWIYYTKNGRGNYEIEFSVAANNDIKTRTATLTITPSGGESCNISITQEAGEAYLIIEGKTEDEIVWYNTVYSSGATLQCYLSSNLRWVISSNQTWLTATPSEGSGDGFIRINVDENTRASIRQGTLTFTSPDAPIKKTLTIEQRGATPYLSFDPYHLELPGHASCADVKILTNADWEVASSDAAWCTASVPVGRGSDIMEVCVEANRGTETRYASITLSYHGRLATYYVYQAVDEYFIEVSPDHVDMPATASCMEVQVMSNTRWTASSNAPWCTISQSNGFGSAVIEICVTEWKLPIDRSAVITVTSYDGSITKTISVTQKLSDSSDSDPYLTLSTNDLSVTAAASISKVKVYSNDDWEVTPDNNQWYSVKKSSLNDNFSIITQENTASVSRSAVITVKSAHGIIKKLNLLQNARSGNEHFNEGGENEW